MWTQIRLLLEEQSDLGPQFAKMTFKILEEQSEVGPHCLQK